MYKVKYTPLKLMSDGSVGNVPQDSDKILYTDLSIDKISSKLNESLATVGLAACIISIDAISGHILIKPDNINKSK